MPVGAATVALAFAPTFMARFEPELILYVTVTGKALGLVNVTKGAGDELWQTVVVPLIVATGVGFTVSTAILELAEVQPILVPSSSNKR